MLLGEKEGITGEVYNLGLGKTVSILELADMILEILKLKGRTAVSTTGVSWQGDVTKIWFDITKAKKELGWTPKVTLEDSIREVIADRKIKI